MWFEALQSSQDTFFGSIELSRRLKVVIFLAGGEDPSSIAFRLASRLSALSTLTQSPLALTIVMLASPEEPKACSLALASVASLILLVNNRNAS